MLQTIENGNLLKHKDMHLKDFEKFYSSKQCIPKKSFGSVPEVNLKSTNNMPNVEDIMR